MDLTIKQLSVGYRSRRVLHDISLVIPAGQFVGLIGPNGAGKTTLIRAISGVLTPASGTIRLGKTNLVRLRTAEHARLVAVVPQRGQLPDGFTAGEVVMMGRTPHLSRFGGERPADITAARQAMVRAGILELAQRSIGELSGGEQQRTLIARALAQEPQVLLLDEATSHLDPKHQTTILSVARELAHSGLIVIAALHDLNLAALYTDRLVLLRDGAVLADGSVVEVLTPERLREAYDVEAVVGNHPHYPVPLVAFIPDGTTEPQNRGTRKQADKLIG